MFWIKPPLLFKPYLPNALWQVKTDEKVIYLTFDDGPHPATTPFILDALADYNFKATFFCLGKNIEEYPELFSRMKQEGHSIGNHTFDHLNGWTTNNDEYLNNVEQANSLIQSSLFRPPYGRLTYSQKKILNTKYRVVMWSLMPEDFKTSLSSEVVLNRLTESVDKRNLVVLHENDKSIKHITAILPRYLSFLKENGYTVKSLPYDN